MRNMQKRPNDGLRAPIAPKPPIVARDVLIGLQLTFIEFLQNDACKKVCVRLFGGANTSAGTMLREFRKAIESHYYGVRAGKLTESKAATKRLLKKFARRAYRGDPDHRGVKFWERVAWLVWQVYVDLMALRARAERIKQQEVARIADISKQRERRALYMRRYRAKLRANPKHIKDGTRRDRDAKRTKNPHARKNAHRHRVPTAA